MASWFAGLALALTVGWLIWKHADIADPDIRFAAAVAAVLIWAIVPVIFWRVFTRRDRSDETPRLHDQRMSALAFLADHGVKGRRARYSIPFYLVAGPPGGGKSSLLERSETGVGMPNTIGNATWWVGQDAVFVETSLGLPGSPPRDVFELLRSIRPKLPVNGTLLVVSPADLTLADEAERRIVAQSIADGLRELENVTRTVTPVYLLLSKIDLVPGFREFFDRQEPQERSQAWGFSLPFEGRSKPRPAEAANKSINEGFDSILMALRLRHVESLSREADPVRCGRIQGFAAQIAALQHAIKPIVQTLIPEQTRAWNGAALRGIYLTSARQEPLSIDALLPELSHRFAMPRIGTLPPDLGMDEEDRGYFIAGALRKALLPEAGLAMRERRDTAIQLVHWMAITAIVLASMAGAYSVFQIFDDEVRLAARVTESSEGIGAITDPSSLDELPNVLAELRRINALQAELESSPPAPRYVLGLSSRWSLKSALETARRNLLVNALAPHLSALIETQLVDPDADISSLENLITVAESLNTAESEAVRKWLEASAARLSEEDRADLVSEGMAALRATGGLEIDSTYVDAAQRMIAYRESLS